MSEVHVREVVGTIKVVDGDALLTGPLLEKIVAAVIRAMSAETRDEHRRKKDTQIGGACCDACEGEER
jgi:hypothetical protein